MNRFLAITLLLLSAMAGWAQGSVRGRVADKSTGEDLGFANVRVTKPGSDDFIGGATTDIDGLFTIRNLKEGRYVLTITMMGYKTLTRDFTVTAAKPDVHLQNLRIAEDSKMLGEVTVTGQQSAMRLEVDRKSFDVAQDIANAGQSASEVLENIPSVEVDTDGNISLRGNESVEVWINGKASGLTADNRAQILQQLPAESIERIEIIDNPSAKFSAEGSAGIINIVLKKDRKPGYYGSVQAGGTTRKGANTSANINYNSSLIDAYLNIGYRHRRNTGKSESTQTNPQTNEWQRYATRSTNQGNNLFSRAGISLHAGGRDDISLSGMMMHGGRHDWSTTPYYYGTGEMYTRELNRQARSGGHMHMLHGEMSWQHHFSEDGRHYLDVTASAGRWRNNDENTYNDTETLLRSPVSMPYVGGLQSSSDQSLLMRINNKNYEVKADYENPVTEQFKIQAGYQGRFSHENTPQETWITPSNAPAGEPDYFNRFIYDMDLHALYTTLTYNFGKFGLMAGLRGEYWKVNTESYDWTQENDATLRTEPFKKDYFQLFPSLFASYQLTPNDQLQLNYTRRLRRPWGGQLNSYRDTRDATRVSFGNPELTPEFSNSFSFNYLRTWTEHSMLISAYYRPTTDVMQRINWISSADGMMYQTHKNVAKSQSSGLEATIKNKFFSIVDLSTNINAYYYHLNGFDYFIDGQTVSGTPRHSFTWNARMQASVILPYDFSVQLSGRYRSRQAITQGYRKAGYNFDLGMRKNFFDKKLVLSVNCRDVLNSRRFRNYTSSDSFERHQLFRRGGRNVIFTLTWNFGSNNKPKEEGPDGQDMQQDDGMQQGGFEMGGE